jgi:phosphohistidine phosphatase SixA
MSKRALLAAILLAPSLSQAQQPAPMAPTRPPVVDPAKAIGGQALVAALRRGGFIVYVRHAQQGGPQQEAPPCTYANLLPQGEAQAKALGEALHRLAIPIGRVRSSQFCRAIETARLLGFGEPELVPGLAISAPDTPELHAARGKILAEAPPAGSNVLVVSHGHASRVEAERIQLDLLEVIVFRPDGRGHTEPVARVRLADWAALH